MRCTLTTVTVNFERFSSAGTPDRASISFTVTEEFNIFGMVPTNPTSGGMPGRQRHIVSASENMQTISMAAYGTPGVWRGVAEVNGIDDPFRVKPGDTVYLPNANEIIGKR
jgi:nucleoid-associated protein YgaU